MNDGQYISIPATVSLTIDSTISGQGWLDSNQDGLEDNSEAGMSGVTVDLVTPDGATVSSTTTGLGGYYVLDADPTLSSQYQILVEFPTGYSATIPFASSSGIFSSIDDAGYSNLLTLPSSGGLSNVNAGLVSGAGPLASISGEVWLDSNDDGILESSEVGLQSINVNLLNGNGAVVDSTSTDANGDYSFFGLSPNTPYTVQFVAANGYVFSPETTGPPNLGNSYANANGDTNPITLSAGQSEASVDAGLYGSAPIVYQTYVPMMAENDSYTGMELTADGYDPNGKPLTAVLVQAPTYGSLSGLTDYTAPTGYVGLDSFEFELSNGSAVSDVVTVQILAYGQTLPPGTYDNFPLVANALYTPTQNVPAGDAPDPSSVKQGSVNDCWFVATAAGLAQQNPAQIKGMLTQNPNGTYTAYFPAGNLNGYNVNFAGDTNNYSTANGDWLKALEKGYARMMWVNAGKQPNNNYYNYINTGEPITWGIETLTGHNTIRNNLALTPLDTLRQNLANAFANNKVVVAATAANARWLRENGLVKDHAYTVVGFNAATNQIRLRNPWQTNPVYKSTLGSGTTYRGKGDSDNPPSNTTGYFWMSLSTFQRLFGEIAFEQ